MSTSSVIRLFDIPLDLGEVKQVQPHMSVVVVFILKFQMLGDLRSNSIGKLAFALGPHRILVSSSFLGGHRFGKRGRPFSGRTF